MLFGLFLKQKDIFIVKVINLLCIKKQQKHHIITWKGLHQQVNEVQARNCQPWILDR